MNKKTSPVMEQDDAVGRDLTIAEAESFGEPRHDKARPIPRISIQAFCEEGATAETLQAAALDRRLSKTHVSVHMGSIAAAVAHYQESPTPNLIIVESMLPRAQM